MKCPSCGKENTGDSRFCAFCGGKLAAENNAKNAVNRFENNYEKKPKKSKLPVIIAVIIAAVILLVAGFFVLKFTVLDAFAQESRVKGGLTDFFTVNDDIAELEKSFKKNSGYIKPSEINIVLDKVGDYAKEKLDAGEIKDYAVTENESVWIQFTSGVEYIYVPQTEEAEKTNDETKTEDSSQQGGSDESENNSSQEAQSHQAALRIFDKQSEEISEEKLKEISEQYKLELTDSEELTLEMIEEIGKDKLVVWYGDGGYSEKTSALLPTSVRLDEERLQNDPEYLKELGYYEEYLSGGIICTNGGYIAVTSKFFESRTETFDGSVFYLGSASSGKDDVLAKTLLEKKASAVLANTEAICQDYNLDMINSVLSGMWRANSEKKYNSLSEALAKAKEKNGDFCCDDHPNTEVTIFGNGADSFRFSEGEISLDISSLVTDAYCDKLGRIPKIELDGEEIEKINSEIWEELYSQITELSEYYERTNWEPMERFTYEWSVNDNILSLVIESNPAEYHWIEYYVYNVDIYSCTSLSDKEVISAAGYSMDDYYEKAKQAMGSKFRENNSYLEDYKSANKNDSMIEMANQQLRKTIAKDNVEDTHPYMNDKGELCITAQIYSMAGADLYWHKLNLEDFKLYPNYDKKI